MKVFGCIVTPFKTRLAYRKRFFHTKRMSIPNEPVKEIKKQGRNKGIPFQFFKRNLKCKQLIQIKKK